MIYDRPLVSVIVPVYNSERFLVDCLDSIINQTYRELEIILIDDGSLDNSGTICDEYSRFCPKIKVFHIDNSGVSKARNIGLDKASGKYVCFIDSDDVVDKEYIAKLLEPYLCKDIQLSICGILEELVLTNERRVRKCKSFLTGKFTNDYFSLIDFLRVPFSKLYLLEIIRINQIKFPVDMSYAEDQVFNFQYYYHVKKYAFIDKPLYVYMLRPNSLSDLSNCRNHNKFSQYYRKLEYERMFLDENCIANKEKLFSNHLIPAITRFACLNDYRSFKNDVVRIKKLQYINFETENFKKSFFWKLIMMKIIWPVYLACILRDWIGGLANEQKNS